MTTLTFTDAPLLLVEDDAVFRDLLSQRLEALGFTVHAAEALESAEQLIARHSFDYAILDLKLQQQSSLPLIAPLRQRNPRMRILMLTGYASIATAVSAIKLGADQYLAKPASSSEIITALTAPEESPAIEAEANVELNRMSVRRLEWEHIQQVLAENDGNISVTARQLQMHRRTLQRKLGKRPVGL